MKLNSVGWRDFFDSYLNVDPNLKSTTEEIPSTIEKKEKKTFFLIRFAQ